MLVGKSLYQCREGHGLGLRLSGGAVAYAARGDEVRTSIGGDEVILDIGVELCLPLAACPMLQEGE